MDRIHAERAADVDGEHRNAGPYSDTIDLFKNAGASATFFGNCYGYAVFPSVGQGGLVVGGAYGKGRVFEHDQYVGDTSMTQVSLGAQAGGRAYSMIIFFEDQRAFKEFTNGNYEFGADANAVAITVAASSQVGTTGANSGASGGKNDATTRGQLLQGCRRFHDREGRRHGSGCDRRPEIHLLAQIYRLV